MCMDNHVDSKLSTHSSISITALEPIVKGSPLYVLQRTEMRATAIGSETWAQKVTGRKAIGQRQTKAHVHVHVYIHASYKINTQQLSETGPQNVNTFC